MANSTIQRARRLRRDATDAEALLWCRLRTAALPLRARRQHPVEGYIADFAFVLARLVIEVDGGQHAGSETDRDRDRRLRAAGWRVLRFWNHEVTDNIEGVLETIAQTLATSPLHPPSPCKRGEGG
ncbi:endonuclease domain-containing protein [Zavarzinia compransoris]|uniref:DNA methyltransferase n=1 Tax=Zavarzinia compransoris TaxID=1264899 RepID=A0A317E0V4_9PROT|nr:DUF559 domain-containing protein [Zavarzinia compransoris]PWR20074.1 DNA methyltransferase [Zavarzinia compransoris]TDP44802.1 very-short-patch-repair endonuclease [Zavarzinia compransoris]